MNYTKVTIKKTVYEQAKIQAAAENRSVMNYIERLILNDTKVEGGVAMTQNDRANTKVFRKLAQEAQSEAPSVDEIIGELLGEFHEHKCVTCKGSKEGCINCRKTGYDQTPCLLCDKDGIAFKKRREAAAKINRLIAKQVVEARLDELTSLDNRRQHPVRNWGEVTDIDGKKHTLIETRRYDWEKTIENRIKELTEQLGEK